MEENIFPLPEVSGVLTNLIEARLHTDRPGIENYDRIIELQERFTGTRSLPIYLVIDPDTEEVLARHNGATFDPAVFIAFLEKGLGSS